MGEQLELGITDLADFGPPDHTWLPQPSDQIEDLQARLAEQRAEIIRLGHMVELKNQSLRHAEEALDVAVAALVTLTVQDGLCGLCEAQDGHAEDCLVGDALEAVHPDRTRMERWRILMGGRWAGRDR